MYVHIYNEKHAKQITCIPYMNLIAYIYIYVYREREREREREGAYYERIALAYDSLEQVGLLVGNVEGGIWNEEGG